ncbi:MAG: SpoIIE family protein phosphatase [Candidatus Eiseniibacteriota bacterium]
MIFWLTGEHHGDTIRHRLEPGICTVGRSATNGLPLPSQTVSRAHAEIRVADGGVRIVDLNSLNGTRVNGIAVEPGQPREAQPGDLIEFGSVVLRLADREDSSVPTWSEDGRISESIHLSREDTGQSALELAAQDSRLLGLVIEAGQLLVDPGDPQETFEQIVELVERVIPATRILILEKEGEGQPVQRAAREKGTRALSPLMLSRTMVRMVLNDGASLLTGDAQADDRFKNQQSIVAQDLHSAMAAPLVHDEDIMGILYVDTVDPVTSYSERDLRVLTLLGQMLGAKIANARLVLIRQEKERLQRDLETAAAIQRRLLPSRLPDVPGYHLRGRQDTCEDVGGDLYDAGATASGGCQIVLGDVSGKGIGAALLMSDVLGAIRVLREEGVGPHDTVARLDRHLLQTTQPEHYVTLFLAELDPQTHRLVYVNSGHPPALLVSLDGTITELDATGMPVGLVDLPVEKFASGSVDFPPGSSLIIYSDGISEAERGSELYGEGRLARCLRECAGKSADEVLEAIFSDVESFLGAQTQLDDVTLLVVTRER